MVSLVTCTALHPFSPMADLANQGMPATCFVCGSMTCVGGAPKEQADGIERQIQGCIDAGLILEYKDGDYPQHCGPCFLVAKPGSTTKRLVVDYGELNKMTLNHSGSIPNMESTAG